MSASKQRQMVIGSQELLLREAQNDIPKEIFVYAGNVTVFGEKPRGSDYRIAVLEIPLNVSPTKYHWPVEGYEIFLIASNYTSQATHLLVSELFSYGAARVSVNTQHGKRISHVDVYAKQEACA